MSSSLVELLNHLKDETAKGQFPPSELFELGLNEQIFGPISRVLIRQAMEKHFSTLGTQCYVRSVEGQDDWQLLQDHKLFQRRKPQLVPQTSAPSEKNFLILKEGQKWGPYATVDLAKMLEKIDLLYTDLISFDQGATWIKVYEFDGVDRRRKSLPQNVPSGDVFQKSFQQSLKVIKDGSPAGSEDGGLPQVMATLAYLGGPLPHKKNGNKKDPNPIPTNASVNKESETIVNSNFAKSDFFSTWGEKIMSFFGRERKGVAVVGTIVVLAIFLVRQGLNKKTSSPQESSGISDRNTNENREENIFSVKNTPRQEMANKNDETNNNDANEEHGDQQLTKQRSFKRSRAYRSVASESSGAMENHDAADGPAPYDDGQDPVEQDNVRNKLSKETIDPPTEAMEGPTASADHDRQDNDPPPSEE